MFYALAIGFFYLIIVKGTPSFYCGPLTFNTFLTDPLERKTYSVISAYFDSTNKLKIYGRIVKFFYNIFSSEAIMFGLLVITILLLKYYIQQNKGNLEVIKGMKEEINQGNANRKEIFKELNNQKNIAENFKKNINSLKINTEMRKARQLSSSSSSAFDL